MVVAAVKHGGMQVHLAVGGDRFERVYDQVGWHFAHDWRLEIGADDGVGTAAQVDDGAGQSLIHRHIGCAHALDAAARAKRLVNRATQTDGDVLNRMMGVDVQIALGLDAQVEFAMMGDMAQHVVVEADAVLISAAPAPSRQRLNSISVSLVFREISAFRAVMGFLLRRKDSTKSEREQGVGR